MKSLLKPLLLAAAALGATALTGCQDGDDNGPLQVFVTMASFVDQNEQGSTFTIQQGADTPPVTLTSERQLPLKNFPIGCRLLLAYTNEANNAYAPGAIDLVDYGTVINGSVEVTDKSVHGTYEIDIQALWRTGTYVNMAVNLPYKVKYEKFALEVDASALESPVPDVYIVYEPDTQSEADWNGYYASIDIAEVWNHPGVEGVRIRYVGTGVGETLLMKR